jgi:hypothetical protein
MPPNTIAPICPAAYALGLLPTLKKSVNKYAAAPNDSDGANDLVSHSVFSSARLYHAMGRGQPFSHFGPMRRHQKGGQAGRRLKPGRRPRRAGRA